MRKLKIEFEYCYGIKKLKHEFIFQNRTFAIYAPNGVMKTSFSNVFRDFSKNEPSKDLAFPSRETKRTITADVDIDSENVFIIEPYVENYQSEKISTLLANKELKKEYEEIHKEIDKSKNELIKKLKQLSGLTGRKDNIENEVLRIFGESFFDFLLNNEDFIKNTEVLPFHDIQYQIIFNDKVIRFLETKDFKKSIKDYIEKYNELINNSPYLKREFNYYHAENVQKQLASNNFFKVGHSVNLFDGQNKTEYNNEDDLKSIFEEEKKKVLENDELQDKFNEINSKLTNNELRNFRDYLLDNRDILPELVDLNSFKQKIWLSYFVNQKDLTIELISKYKAGQTKIKELVEKAIQEKTEWEEVIRIFNTRFSHLPFYLKIKNKDDVILKGDIPSVEFVFKDGEDEKIFNDRNDLLRVLSTGEKRALYILNVIFEVEARKKEDGFTLFIIDDIADSFDYKNKYAIIEYLKYMSDIEKFFMIILSHNFDFYRTIQSRAIVPYNQCLIALKNNNGIHLEQISYLKNPFIRDWKNHLNDNKKLIASIPFVRNIIEYTQSEENEDYLLLTSILHFKGNTNDITLSNVKDIFEKYIQNIQFPSDNLENKVIDLIYETAEQCLNAEEGINLENKIVLSIAIRLKAEEFMKSKITDIDFLRDLESQKNQMWHITSVPLKLGRY
ncbi:hypothetical protein [Xiashengella succiniciproducens]|uniref:Phage infection protein n=1 Tax=Xiashengella succiniciproducens TaxID=2949635 RepID=A0A9J6ZTG8_9BACT|nr:hypothetical protein [Alkaliflexus sp. Ai-910]URW80897.1 hypothetical protein M9189_05975 [Alkaliflexus sp. Ai-910]